MLFAMHLLETRNIISCAVQVLLLCVKSCLPPLHDYLEIDGIVPPIREKNDWFLNGISNADFQTNVKLCQYVQSFISLSDRFC